MSITPGSNSTASRKQDGNIRSSRFRMDPSRVYFLKFILEGYDNLFVLSTIDSERGIVEIQHVEGTRQELNSILMEVSDFIGLRSRQGLD